MFVANNLVIVAIRCHALFFPLQLSTGQRHSWQLQKPFQLWAEPGHKKKMRFGTNLAAGFPKCLEKMGFSMKILNCRHIFAHFLRLPLSLRSFPLKIVFVFVNFYRPPAQASPYINSISSPLSCLSSSSMNGDTAKTRQNNFLAILPSTLSPNLCHHLNGDFYRKHSCHQDSCRGYMTPPHSYCFFSIRITAEQ